MEAFKKNKLRRLRGAGIKPLSTFGGLIEKIEEIPYENIKTCK